MNHHPKAHLDRQAFYEHAKSWDIERDVPWMYQDKNHHVTVGIGHKIESAEDAVDLARLFENREERGRPVTREEILEAFAIVSSPEHTGNFDASHYEPLTTLRLKTLESFDLFHDDVDEILRQLMAHEQYSQTKFDTFPPEAKFAIADLAFNMGARRLAIDYPIFTGAVHHRNWALAVR
ncbi:MAG TPA: hypothetical protein QF665_03385 [Alphaproteobacteria bacterium]|nr:hypothetical protein [Alphaproteobacteria bacterium]